MKARPSASNLNGEAVDILTDQVSIFGAHPALRSGPQGLGHVLLGAATDKYLAGDDADRVRRNRLQNRSIASGLARALAAADMRQTRLMSFNRCS